ncbi:MAG TPA: hypothetical protein VK735_18770 [Pseudonocardia sp.]|uniref:hypothetical protein n=1 Tax=Pseudonocardia sp. TaxID=60912 RepID=UPI002D0F0055|nr:hypothetical protein [Pseudonocardia sp.]HTF49491.1 hypothetical protein [Pseudonocardia sp.]
MSVPWWMLPRWLDLELVRYLAACETETGGGEHMARQDPRTQQEKLHDRNTKPTGAGNQRDAKHQGAKK